MQLDPNFALAWARLSRADAQLYFSGTATTVLGAMQRNVLWKTRRNWSRTRRNPARLGLLSILGARDYGLAKTTFGRVSKMLPGSSDVP